MKINNWHYAEMPRLSDPVSHRPPALVTFVFILFAGTVVWFCQAQAEKERRTKIEEKQQFHDAVRFHAFKGTH
jgi:hypothetical protein